MLSLPGHQTPCTGYTGPGGLLQVLSTGQAVPKLHSFAGFTWNPCWTPMCPLSVCFFHLRFSYGGERKGLVSSTQDIIEISGLEVSYNLFKELKACGQAYTADLWVGAVNVAVVKPEEVGFFPILILESTLKSVSHRHLQWPHCAFQTLQLAVGWGDHTAKPQSQRVFPKGRAQRLPGCHLLLWWWITQRAFVQE